MMIFFLKVMVNLTGLWFEGSKGENKHSNKKQFILIYLFLERLVGG